MSCIDSYWPDFLDVLRELNPENINDDPQKRDEFFRCLYPYKLFPTSHPDSLVENSKSFRDKRLGNLNLQTNDSKADEIFDEAIKEVMYFFKQCCYVINKKDATYYVDYARNYRYSSPSAMESAIKCDGYIEVIIYLIEKVGPSYFDRFKKEFIETLLLNLCMIYPIHPSVGLRNYYNYEEDALKRIINKTIAIYGEEIGVLKFKDAIPQVTDDEFFTQLKLLRYITNYEAYNKILEIINNLLERKKLGSRGK